MATDNYLKIHRPGSPAVEFFFDSHHPASVASARLAADGMARTLEGLPRPDDDPRAERNATFPEVVDDVSVRVWTHGVRGLGGLHCVGGCDLCAHPMRLRGVVELVDDAPDEGLE